MITKDINNKNYNLHLLKDKRYKTTVIKIVFSSELKKEELTLRNLLVNNLLFSSKKYNSIRKMNIKKDDLFGIDLYSRTYRNGNLILSEITLSSLSEKYIENSSIKDALDFLFEIIKNPNIENEEFEQTSYRINYDRLKNILISEKDDPYSCALKGFRELVGIDKKYGVSILGTLEDLEKITSKNLYEYYKKFLKENQIDVYVTGTFNEKKLEEVLSKNITWLDKNNKYESILKSYTKEFTEKEETSKFNQSKIILGASLNKLTPHEKLYESIVYNVLLGNSPSSKLFKNVREKKSYAYSISSSINRLDGSLVIYAGISLKNAKDTKEEVNKQINDIKQGKFTLKELNEAKQMVLSIIKEIEERQESMIYHYMNYLYFGTEDVKTQIQEIKKITKEDIIKVANKIEIDTIYLLKEDEHGKSTNK